MEHYYVVSGNEYGVDLDTKKIINFLIKDWNGGNNLNVDDFYGG